MIRERVGFGFSQGQKDEGSPGLRLVHTGVCVRAHTVGRLTSLPCSLVLGEGGLSAKIRACIMHSDQIQGLLQRVPADALPCKVGKLGPTRENE